MTALVGVCGKGLRSKTMYLSQGHACTLVDSDIFKNCNKMRSSAHGNGLTHLILTSDLEMAE